MANPETLPFCPICPVRLDGYCKGPVGRSIPVLQVAGYIDEFDSVIKLFGPDLDPSSGLEPHETEDSAASIIEAADICMHAIRYYMNLRPEPAQINDAVREALRTCATNIATGTCQKLPKI